MPDLVRGRYARRGSDGGALAVVVLALGLLGFALGRVPGLHGDEAWTLLRVAELRAGSRPLDGMTFYTGALYQYLVWPWVWMLGPGAAAARSVAVLANVAALWLYMRALRELPEYADARWTGLLLCTSPAFVTSARFGVEITALTPLLVVLSALLLLHSQRARRPLSAGVLAGICLGLAIYNHVLAVAVPLALLVGLALADRARLRGDANVPAVLLGTLLGLSPRLVSAMSPLGLASWSSFSAAPSGSFAADLRYLPALLERLWDGSLLYQRYVGVSWLWVPPYPALALMGLVALRVCAGFSLRMTRLDSCLLLALAAFPMLVTAIAPYLSDRYFLLVFWALPLLLTRVAHRALVDARPLVRNAARGLLAVVVASNLAWLSANYFGKFLATGGTVSAFAIGTRALETSAHFVRTDRVYQQLRARGVQQVIADTFLVWGFRVYAWGASDEGAPMQLRASSPRLVPPGAGALRTALVYYAGEIALNGRAFDATSLGDVVIADHQTRYRYDATFDPNFRVYLSEPQ